jgi:hypothetical protein
MMATDTTNTVAPSPAREWPLFLPGILLFIIGPVAYFIQIQVGRIDFLPLYVPVLATIGVLLIAASIVQRPRLIRILFLISFTALCGFEWFFLLVATRTPEYTGPVQIGQKLPAFAAARVDGKNKTFSQSDLETGERTAIIFFRGRW